MKLNNISFDNYLLFDCPSCAMGIAIPLYGRTKFKETDDYVGVLWTLENGNLNSPTLNGQICCRSCKAKFKVQNGEAQMLTGVVTA